MDVTVGIDLATTSGVCVIEWSPLPAIQDPVVGKLDDDRIVSLVKEAAGAATGSLTVAIDAPFGFPDRFRAEVAALPGLPEGDRPFHDAHTRRFTDWYTHEAVKQCACETDGTRTWPLSSVTERITPTVLRSAILRSRLRSEVFMDVRYRERWDDIHTGSPVIETYPAAALRLWDLLPLDDGDKIATYKDPDAGKARELIVTSLLGGIGAPAKDERVKMLAKTDDHVDSLVCSLMARYASAVGHSRATNDDLKHHADGVEPVAVKQVVRQVKAEGWIHLPLADSAAAPANPRTGSRDTLALLATSQPVQAGRRETASTTGKPPASEP